MSISTVGLAKKLLWVCLAFGIPIAVMWVLLTQAKLREIDFARKELAGDAFQRPLERVLEHVGRHRRLEARVRRGESALTAQLATESHAVDSALVELAARAEEHGEELQFTPAGLELRGRGRFTVSELERSWRGLGAQLRAGNTSEADATHAALTSHVRTMITHAGDTSNLILDPDLDSYYLMDATLLVLPQMEERIQQIAATVDELDASSASAEELHRLDLLAAFLRQSDWDRIVASVHTAINEDSNFYGTSPTLKATLLPHLDAGGEALLRVVASIDSVSSGSARGFDEAAFHRDIDALDAAIYAFHHAALDEEDALVLRRIGVLERSLYWGLALAAASVVVSALLAFALSSHIVRRLKNLTRATEALASGDLEVRVADAAGDELGQLGRSFDVMTQRIGGLTAEVRRRAQELEQINGNLEKNVAQRTQELTRRNEAFRLILDNVHDGMLTVDLDGVVADERSVAVERWFGEPAAGVTLAAYLAPADATLAAAFSLGLEQIQRGFLPLELTLDQLPRSMQSGQRHLRISYQPILEGGVAKRLLVVLADVTSEVEGRQAAELQKDVLRMFQACERDRPGFLNFFMDARDLVQTITGPCTAVELRRAIHTLKGNGALFGVLGISKVCHEVENALQDNGDLTPSDIGRIESAWAELSKAVARVVGDERYGALEVPDAEYRAILDAIAGGTPRRALLAAIASWKLEPAERRLKRLGDQALYLARRLGKEVQVATAANGVRLCAETWSPVWSALAHAIRNAIDHGIEGPRERTERGAPEHGTIRLEVREVASYVVIEIADDGRGIQWESLAQKAKAAGLPHQTRDELVEALFADGISSRDLVTETSGRGVGMGALRHACLELGGHVEIDSEVLRGTTVRCKFPNAVMGGRTLAHASARSIQASISPSA